MKKIFYIMMVAVLSVLLISCKKEYEFGVTINTCTGLRNSVVVNYTITDPNQAIKNSSINGEIYKSSDLKTPVKVEPILYDTTVPGEITFIGLDGGTDYTVKIYTSYEGKQVYLAETTVKTTVVGNEVDTPYEISTVSDFMTILKNDPNGHFKLVNDIDFAAGNVQPLFDSTKPFNGTFDGNGFKIFNFKVGEVTNLTTIGVKYYGLFGYIGSKGVVRNLVLDTFSINVMRSSSTTFVGLLAGYNAGTIENVDVKNSTLYLDITSSSSSLQSDSSGSLTGYYAGGLVGHNRNGSVIKDCEVDLDMTVKAKRHVIVGGICAVNFDNTTVSVKEDYVQVSNCSYTGTIDVTISSESASAYESTTCVGGIMGRNYSSVDNCTSTGSIILNSKFKTPSTDTYRIFAGGLVGWNNGDGSVVSNATSSMTLTVASTDALEVYAGLLVGKNGGTANTSTALVSNCTYTTPEGGKSSVEVLKGNDNVGLVGKDDNDTKTSYSATNAFSIEVKSYDMVEAEDGTKTLELVETKNVTE